ncbi:CDP-alcohol phosphatidyltransferase family protein [Thaumasiovibrio sp. DFM-14]|uniref:CDP-alcohol phosphatidyltransferase family protein n=1 Tax=Thaumasiovibrio sp. DFM-14 TaxID=3384792 RepID=UPI0039A376E3
MIDRWTAAAVKPPLHLIAQTFCHQRISANHVTVCGFFIGMLALPLLAFEQYLLALVCVLFNRFCDGLDGAIARVNGGSDLGGFLDIVLDFIFYAAVICGFALAQPENAVFASLLLFGFMGTASSFLAFSSIAAKREIDNPIYPNKALYYLGGITEGSETIAFFVAMCLFPQHFVALSLTFAILCYITTFTRIMSAIATFKE